MDTIPRSEFIGIFDRATKYINVEGAFSPEVIEERMKKTQKAMLKIQHLSKKERTKKYWYGRRKHIKTLRTYGFQDRVIAEAIRSPRGKIGLTLLHGKERAEEIRLADARKRLRGLRCRRLPN